MNFVDAVKTCFQKYATFSGRASRSEFWWFFLAMFIVSFITGILDSILFSSVDSVTGKVASYTPINTICTLLALIPNISVGARRLHDINKSGWWQLIAFTFIGLIPLLFWFCTKSTAGDNRFGPDPLAEKTTSA